MALDAIGLVSGVLGIVDFAESHLPGAQPQGTSVFVKTGNYNTLQNGGGKVKDVFGFDFQNGYIGKGSGTATTNNGGGDHITIDQATPNKQADFVDVTFTGNDMCVAWISVRMHDGSPGGGWTGDIGKACGQGWHKSSSAAGHKKNGDIYRPACTWFDGNLDDGHAKGGGVKFRTRAYGSQSQDTLNKGNGCKSTIFSKNNKVINGAPAKRGVKDDRPDWIAKTLIVSKLADDADAAEELCTSETSWGWDFLSHGMFCDMGTKTLHPLCDVKSVPGCVELSNNTLTMRNVVQAREVYAPFKEYEATDLWEADAA